MLARDSRASGYCIVRGKDNGLPVHRLVVSLGGDYFRSKIIWSSTQGPSDIGDILRETKVCNLQVAMAIEQKILWLEITVDDLVMVQVLKS